MRRANRSPHARQYDLFRTSPCKPDWPELPMEVREKVARLMARLLRERRQLKIGERPSGGRDDE